MWDFWKFDCLPKFWLLVLSNFIAALIFDGFVYAHCYVLRGFYVICFSFDLFLAVKENIVVFF